MKKFIFLLLMALLVNPVHSGLVNICDSHGFNCNLVFIPDIGDSQQVVLPTSDPYGDLY